MSFDRPPIFPHWAIAAAVGDVIDPGPSKRDSGWLPAEKPSHATFNWIDKEQSDFIEYLETVILDTNSLWNLGAFKLSSNMTVNPATGLTGTLAPRIPFGGPSIVGSIYNANGQKTTWSDQDLLNSGDTTHLYPASRDTYLAYRDTDKAIEYNDVPNDDPAPTPTSGYVNFLRVVTDATDVVSSNGTLPGQPTFDVEPTFTRLGLGLADVEAEADGLLRAGDDSLNGSSGVAQSIRIIGHSNSDRELQFHSNTSPQEIDGSVGLVDTVWLRLQTKNGSGVRDTVQYRYFPQGSTLTAASDTDDFIIATAMDNLGHHTRLQGRVTLSGGGGFTILARLAVPAGDTASANYFFQEEVATVGRVSTVRHMVFDGGSPPTVTQVTVSSSQTGGLGAADLGFGTSGSDVILQAVDTGANARRYNFSVDFFQSVAP